MFVDKKRKNIVMMHPDLGIGGAERLFVDAALALQRAGHTVKILTGKHNREKCFEATRDGTLDVNVVGQWIPASICGRFRAPFAILKMVWISLVFRVNYSSAEIVFCDLVSHHIPVLKFISQVRVIYYCHFPDKLLTNRSTTLRKLYRLPIDAIEGWGISLADIICVNSQFTSKIAQKTFPRLSTKKFVVLNPCVEIAENLVEEEATKVDSIEVLSINRFEMKKGVHHAIEAISELSKLLSPESYQRVKLIIVGGYNPNLRDARKSLTFLQNLAEQLGVNDHVQFVVNPNDFEKNRLLSRCRFLIYTPAHEHFGIVPLEAMGHGKPVVAVNSGGPCETILDRLTGFLCPQSSHDFAAKMKLLIEDRSLSNEMGGNARAHVQENFSISRFESELTELIASIAE